MEEVTTNIGYEIAKQKYDKYGRENDFAGASELLVTITLAEYRELVGKKYIAERDSEKMARWDAERKVTELEKQVATLKSLIGKDEDENDGK